jgi:hypothetical protein
MVSCGVVRVSRGYLLTLSAQLISPVRRTLWLAVLAATAAVAGPLGFAESEELAKPSLSLDCSYCTFVTSFDPLPEPVDSDQVSVVLGFEALLGLIGMIGVRFRVRAGAKR